MTVELEPHATVAVGPSVVEVSVVQRTRLLDILAEGYREASLHGLPMRQVVDSLELLRKVPSSDRDLYAAWDLLDREVANTDDKALWSFFSKLRTDIREHLQRCHLEMLRTGGTPGWRMVAAAAFVESRDVYFYELLEQIESGRGIDRDELRRVRAGVAATRRDSWADAYDVILEIEGWPTTTPWQRLGLLMFAFDIQLYHLGDLRVALELLERARRINEQDVRVVVGEGKLHANRLWLRGAREKAVKAFEAAISIDPSCVDAYCALAEIACDENDQDLASSWFQKGTRCPRSTRAWRGWLSLYRSREWSRDSEAGVVELEQRATRSDPDSVSSTQEELGRIYYASVRFSGEKPVEMDRFEAARTYFERAAEADRFRLSPRLWLARMLSDTGDPVAARQAYAKEIDDTGDVAQVDLHLLQVLSDHGSWNELLSVANEVLRLRPSWQHIALGYRGHALWKLDKPGARWDLWKSLCMTPWGSAGRTLADLTEDMDLTGARRLLGAIRRVRGPSYESTFHNELGNWHFDKSQYREAVAEYRTAVAADPTNSVLWANLGAGCEQLWSTEAVDDTLIDEGIAAFTRATELDPTRAPRLAKSQRRAKIVRAFGRSGLDRLGGPRVSSVAIVMGSELHEHWRDDAGLQARLRDAMSDLATQYGFALPFCVLVSDRSLSPFSYAVRILGTLTETHELADANVDLDALASAFTTELRRALVPRLWELLELDDVEGWTKGRPPYDFDANIVRLWRTLRLLLRDGVSIAQHDKIIEVCSKSPDRDPAAQVRYLYAAYDVSAAPADAPVSLGAEWEARLAAHSHDGYAPIVSLRVGEVHELLELAERMIDARAEPVVAVGNANIRSLAARILQIRWPHAVVTREAGES